MTRPPRGSAAVAARLRLILRLILNPLLLAGAALLLAPAMTPAQPAASSSPANPAAADPYLWLEDVQGPRALDWVRARNAVTERLLHAQPGFAASRASVLEVLDSREQIPYVVRRGDHLYNVWRDAANPRGLWRRTTLAEYRKPQPAWETVLDIDALGRAEGENWVWAGSTCRGPAYTRCLVGLSRGGADALVLREFDLVAPALHRRRLRAARSQGQRRVGGRRHAAGDHRLRPRLADRFGLPAHRQALEARHTAGRGADRLRRRQGRRQRRRQRRRHAGLRAHRGRAGAQVLRDETVPAAGQPAAARRQARRCAAELSPHAGADPAAQRMDRRRPHLAGRRAAGRRCAGLSAWRAPAAAGAVHADADAFAAGLQRTAPRADPERAGQRRQPAGGTDARRHAPGRVAAARGCRRRSPASCR